MKNEIDVTELNALMENGQRTMNDFISLYNSMTVAVAGDGLNSPVGPAIANGLSEVARAIENGANAIAAAQAEGLKNIAVVLDSRP